MINGHSVAGNAREEEGSVYEVTGAFEPGTIRFFPSLSTPLLTHRSNHRFTVLLEGACLPWPPISPTSRSQTSLAVMRSFPSPSSPRAFSTRSLTMRSAIVFGSGSP